ncbi:serine hydrolase domain-containing protein [Neobacillus sp. K501]
MLELSRLSNLEKQITKEKITTCLISINDRLVFTYYKNKKMETKLHKINSVTKSILSLLVGIAIDRNEIESIHMPIQSFFPTLAQNHPEITIEHLLTMSPGIHWPEFSDWGGTCLPMSNSRNWIKFFFERDIIGIPGEDMYYNSGCSHILSAILQQVTRKSVKEYAAEHLFKPLQINDFIWHSDSKGITIGGFGLYLKPADMMKIGKLVLQDGIWKNKVIVSESWIKQATTAELHTYDRIGSYGYHWWILTDEHNNPSKPKAFFAMGYGGQYIIVVPKYNLITTFTSELDLKPLLPLSIFKENIFKEVGMVDSMKE